MPVLIPDKYIRLLSDALNELEESYSDALASYPEDSDAELWTELLASIEECQKVLSETGTPGGASPPTADCNYCGHGPQFHLHGKWDCQGTDACNCLEFEGLGPPFPNPYEGR